MAVRMLCLIFLSLLLSFALAKVGQQQQRTLGGTDIDYDPSTEYCKTGEDAMGHNIYGPCDPVTMFPVCEDDEFICYNRENRRDLFFADHVPHYFINPARIKCYPNSWITDGGCSTCSPGRYCRSEKRCILNEKNHDCAQWL